MPNVAVNTPESPKRPLYPQHDKLDFPAIEREIRAFWEQERIFERSVEDRAGAPSFTFYEGPPSANGTPGIHHVMARAIKDLFCRYQTLKGHQVKRKGGWDTHGLPIELQVEKKLGITKQDIGKTISIEDYNRHCREDVLKFKDQWDELTRQMGFWVDLGDPYVTFDNAYIESLWHLLKQLFDKDLLYKGYTIQPYSPAAGTGLSTHELNQPGTYKEVKDISATVLFEVTTEGPFRGDKLLAWTTTPWTLPANSALAVGANIRYLRVATYNPYTHTPVVVVLASDRLGAYFKPEQAQAELDSYQPGDKLVPYKILSEHTGREFCGLSYTQLMPLVAPDMTDGTRCFVVEAGDFVTTEDGTGIVHCAKTFGADDFRFCQQHGIAGIFVRDEQGGRAPIVDRQGKYTPELGPYANRYVKNYTDDPAYKSLDEDIVVDLKKTGRLFQSQKYEHNYPHCWRTDKPVLYYPLDSWFIRTTRLKDRLVALNKTITWKPASTGTGRFGNWLENLQDWNLSRSRYWGTPLPIWANEARTELKCIGSVAELEAEVERARSFGHANPTFTPGALDLHRPFVDDIVLADSQGQPMRREPDLIDVWFDSGAMPYAQWHWPFENEATFRANFPADFIAEGVDQTRGWFFTLHAIAGLLFDSVAFKTVISNGLVLDKDGNKMSKRLGNAVDPFATLGTYGADPTRWYMIENAPPWENLRFDLKNLQEVQRKFFGTLYNTYQFFALYANVDGWAIEQFTRIPREELPEMDRWVLSRLYSVVREVTEALDCYEPTRAARAIQDFTLDELSNWYVRLNRRRFWKGELSADKRAAYQTLQHCLAVLAQLMSPIAPFFADWLYRNLTEHCREESRQKGTPFAVPSVHLSNWSKVEHDWLDPALEARMALAMDIASLGHGIRKKERFKVRQPLAKLLIATRSTEHQRQLEAVADLLLSELNVKAIEYLAPTSTVLVKTIKPNFKVLGPKLGPKLKAVGEAIAALGAEGIATLEQTGAYTLPMNGEGYALSLEDVEIRTQDIPGWAVASSALSTVALDLTLTEALVHEGIARELVSKIQGLRKDLGFDVTDRIGVTLASSPYWDAAVLANEAYIRAEILATSFQLAANLSAEHEIEIDGVTGTIQLHRQPR
ncbi:MAG: isoleucine--tRNA ligase [Bacteroidia bacterium]|nr:isoleucine--tRNA ligase [Bacteroidia bacterium]